MNDFIVDKHTALGAIHIIKKTYITPTNTDRSDSKNKLLCCSSCKDTVFLRKSKNDVLHFYHKKNSICSNYTEPTTEQIHNNAQYAILSLLRDKVKCLFYRKCISCNSIDEIDYVNDGTDDIQMEYSFKIDNNNYRADIAVLYNSVIPYFIIEVYNTHATSEENRTGDWVEIDATETIKKINDMDYTTDNIVLKLNCIRKLNCDNCIEQNKKNKKIEFLNEIVEVYKKFVIRREKLVQDLKRLEMSHKKAIAEQNIKYENYLKEQKTAKNNKNIKLLKYNQEKQNIQIKIYYDKCLNEWSKSKLFFITEKVGTITEFIDDGNIEVEVENEIPFLYQAIKLITARLNFLNNYELCIKEQKLIKNRIIDINNLIVYYLNQKIKSNK